MPAASKSVFRPLPIVAPTRLAARRSSILIVFAVFWMSLSEAACAVDYLRDIKPLLAHKCASCHGALAESAGLRLDAAVLIHEGGDSGPVIRPGDASASELISRVTTSDAGLRMPPEGEGEPLSPDQIALLSRWIEQGATAPADEPIPTDPRQHWSYQTPRRPPLPPRNGDGWARNPIDDFIAAGHRQHDLRPRPEASREVWLRRVYLDLIGIPPTADQRRTFLSDDSPTAYEAVVDSLLNRPEYGQRWGRHWMDVWRYSDWYGSRGGNEIRYSQRHIWRWRDWIVDSLIADKPYDRMLVEMLAADEVASTDPEALPATGFLGRNWYKFDRNVWMFDTVEHTAQAFLGLTLRCARCHDHKFDPISQQDYYRFRAFFEPHDVRTDPLTASAPREKDATLGMVLADGVARVFDQHAEAPTYLFRRGDDRSPDESRPLAPGVPASLNRRADTVTTATSDDDASSDASEIKIDPVRLPPEAFYPALRPAIADGLIAAVEDAADEAEVQLAAARVAAQAAEAAVAEVAADDIGATAVSLEEGEPADDPSPVEVAPPVLSDDFTNRSDDWQIVSGDWDWQDGKLIERSVGQFATIVHSAVLPGDFRARVTYRTLQPGSYRSVGFSFDYADVGNSQDVYSSIQDTASTVQAFHRVDGTQEYPAAGIVKTPLTVGEPITIEVTVQGQRLRISLAGQPLLDYVMPVPRRDGKLALWVHKGSAEFHQVEVWPLPKTAETLERELADSRAEVALAEQRWQAAVAEVTAVQARVAAERAKYLGGEKMTERRVAELATDAALAERQAEVARAEVAVVAAERTYRDLTASATTDTDATPPTAASNERLEPARQKLAAAETALATARERLAESADSYQPLGEIYPATSTGRRAALARWIASPDNPRTARVAVNQIWMRHIGQPLVPTVANFGLGGQPPSHPELLDWLATEWVENGWRMKPLHRLIVLSATYRQSSHHDADSATRDPENRFLWRMNSQRMEAETVRDSVLAVAGSLDATLGGPEIAETEGQTNTRRSLYFRNTPNEKMEFLDTFDVANPNECYRRQESVVPHQALAMLNSALTIDQSRLLARRLSASLTESALRANADQAADAELPVGADPPAGIAGTQPDAFITVAWETVLGRQPTPPEREACLTFLAANAEVVRDGDAATFPEAGAASRVPPAEEPRQRARENLIHVLLSHNDFVTIR